MSDTDLSIKGVVMSESFEECFGSFARLVDELKKENEELRELLREGCEVMDNINGNLEAYSGICWAEDSDINGTPALESQNKVEYFLYRPEVKALLEKEKV